jgi:hypothetical protein
MDPKRKLWNQQQQALRKAVQADDHSRAIKLALVQHAPLHSALAAQSGVWSLEDDLWQGLSEASARRVPRNEDHSIAWVIWHIARIEDVAMNLLVAGRPQLLAQEGWFEKLNVLVRTTGNEMDRDGTAGLSTAIDLDSLRAYRTAVGFRTNEIIAQLRPGSLCEKVDPARIRRVKDEGAVVEAAAYITDYWSKRTIGTSSCT